MSLISVLNSVRNFLATHHMFVNEDWLSGCVNFFVEETGNNNINDIQCQAKEQWLLNNLTDICPGSLPANLKALQKTTLNGRFILQINAVVDIGTPAYQQYLKLQKVNTENIEATTKFEEKISSHRLIKLYMTDGVQEVTGIEYRSMRNLSLDITSGCKVLIKGPVECRRGMLMLTETSIELLGGEVDDLVCNTQARLLSTKLGLPKSQEPTQESTLSHPRNANIPTPHTQMPPPIRNEPELDPTFDQMSRPVARVTGVPVSFADDDIDMEELNAIEAQYTDRAKRPMDEGIRQPEKKLKVNPSTSANTAEDYPDEDENFFEDEYYYREMEANFDARENELNSKYCEIEAKFDGQESVVDFKYRESQANFNVKENKQSSEYRGTENNFESRENSKYRGVEVNLAKENVLDSKYREIKAEFDVQENVMGSKYRETQTNCNVKENSTYREVEAKFDAKESELNSIKVKEQNRMSPKPYIYIKQIKDLGEFEKAGRVFKVKGQIMKLLSKLTVGKDGWVLKCTIVDGTGCLDVVFTSDVLSGIVGMTPQEMNSIRREIAAKPEMKEKAVSALQKARSNLEALYCIIELTMLETPTITNLIPFHTSHVDLLKRRLLLAS